MRSLIRVAGSAVIGRSHKKDGRPCQDKYSVWRSKDKKAAGIALSDGAGSSPYSQIGAEFTVNSVIPFVHDHFDELYRDPSNAGKRIIESLSGGLSKVAAENGLMLNEMACTMLFVHIRRKRDFVRYLAGHIGDGAIFLKQNNEVRVLSAPERGEYANTTVFVTSEHNESRLRIFFGGSRRPVGFMIMSDGAAETLYVRKTKAPNQVYCAQMFNWCDKYPRRKITKALIMNLEHGVFREVSSDDCSLCILKVT